MKLDKETLKAEAKALGISHVFVKMMNNSGMIMPDRFEQELLKVYVKDLDSEWLDFATRRGDGVVYDFHVVMNIKTVAVTPDKQNEREYVEERDIQDGTEAVLDGRGKPKKRQSRSRYYKAALPTRQSKNTRSAAAKIGACSGNDGDL